jgi:hypothetical protein
MIDYSALLFDPVYNALGVPAMFTGGAEVFQPNVFQSNIFQGGLVKITVIDDTRPKSITTGSLETKSVGPGAFARIPEVTSQAIERADYVGTVITFNGRTWIVRDYELRGSPNGEDLGDVRFLLKAQP